MKTFIKNQIKKYLTKKFNCSHPKHYYFLRWLASLVMDNEEVKDVCASIAYWMYTTKHETLMAYTHDILVIDNKVYIYTYRPGLWIGKAGCIVYDCEHSINHNINDEKIHDYKIHFIETHKTPWTELYGSYSMYSRNW